MSKTGSISSTSIKFQTWFVSGITKDNRRISSSDMEFSTHSQARHWIKSNKGTKFAKEHNIIEFRISKETVIFENDIEKLPLVEALQK